VEDEGGCRSYGNRRLEHGAPRKEVCSGVKRREMDTSYTTAERGVLVGRVLLPYMTIDASSSKPNSQASAQRPIEILYREVTIIFIPVGLRQMQYACVTDA